MRMEINTDSGKYIAKFERCGFDCSQCVIYKLKAKYFILFEVNILVKVWDVFSDKSYKDWVKSSPSEIFREAKEAVDAYERNQKEWKEWRAKK